MTGPEREYPHERLGVGIEDLAPHELEDTLDMITTSQRLTHSQKLAHSLQVAGIASTQERAAQDLGDSEGAQAFKDTATKGLVRAIGHLNLARRL